MESLIHVLWITSIFLQGIVTIVLMSKKMWNDFPVFTAYTLICFVGAVTGFLVRSNAWVYFYVFWVAEGLGIFLGLAVVYEIFSTLFAVHVGLRRLATLLFACSAVVLIGVGALVIALQSTPMVVKIIRSVLIMAEATRIVEVGLFLFLFVFSTAFGLHWRQTLFGIALGLGIYSAVELIAVTIHVHLGMAAALKLSLVRSVSFTTALLLWLGYLLVPEPATVGELPKREQLEQWNKAVMEFMHQ